MVVDGGLIGGVFCGKVFFGEVIWVGGCGEFGVGFISVCRVFRGVRRGVRRFRYGVSGVFECVI